MFNAHLSSALLSALTLSVGWQEAYPAWKKSCTSNLSKSSSLRKLRCTGRNKKRSDTLADIIIDTRGKLADVYRKKCWNSVYLHRQSWRWCSRSLRRLELVEETHVSTRLQQRFAHNNKSVLSRKNRWDSINITYLWLKMNVALWKT